MERPYGVRVVASISEKALVLVLAVVHAAVLAVAQVAVVLIARQHGADGNVLDLGGGAVGQQQGHIDGLTGGDLPDLGQFSAEVRGR